MKPAVCTLALLSLVACSQKPTAKTDAAPAVSASAVPTTTPTVAVATPPGTTPCGTAGPTCFRFDAAEDAFQWILARKPLVIGVGEAHAQKGTEAIASSTKRFTDGFLPLLVGNTQNLVVELWAPDPKCRKAVAAVASAQKPIVAAQAETNQNEYVTLGTKAKAVGITPWLLQPTCDEFAMLADAGDDSVEQMLGMVKELTEQRVRTLISRSPDAASSTIVTYGGALHNDLNPPPETKDFSFGPDFDQLTKGRYVELDLIVPEFIKKSPTWEKLPWFAAFEADRAANKDQNKATLYVLADRSYTLVFPASEKPH